MSEDRVNDEVLGTIVLSEFDEWEAKFNDVSFSLDNLDMRSRARQIATQLDHLSSQAKSFAAQQLISLKNEVWADLDERENPLLITEHQFQERMTLKSVSISGDEVASFWFDDGGLFLGHTILVELDAQNVWLNAEFHG